MASLRSAIIAAGLVFLAACTGGLSSSVQRRIHQEHSLLASARDTVRKAGETVKQEVAGDSALFDSTPQPAHWKAELDQANSTLAAAAKTGATLDRLARENRHRAQDEAEVLLSQASAQRQQAEVEALTAANEAKRWTGFRTDLPANLARMTADHNALTAAALTPEADLVEKAERDWPDKKLALDQQLAMLRVIPQSAESAWNAAEKALQDGTAGSVTGPELAQLIETDQTLSGDKDKLAQQSAELRALTNQLYVAWDKILVDLDDHDGDHRERIRTVRTHFDDVAAKQTETSSEEHWIDVSPENYRAVEGDLGMAIAHKDAGHFDSEAVNTPEPAGFAYIAPEAQGSNQYGYWRHDEGGHSIWTWLPEYLILRELLWNHAYRPVVLEDYRGYQVAQRAGSTYYGRTTPSSPVPEYGTRGTVTRTTYANSRYVQSGSFGRSAYASHASAPSDSHRFTGFSENSSGKRFGTGAAPSSGRRFGSRPSPSRSFGRSFGRHR